MSVDQTKFKDIIDYYDHTRYDYRVAWDNSPTPAVHFGFYDDRSSDHTTALMNTNRVLAEWVNIQEGDLVLDAGCGKGGSCFWLALNKNVKTIGITPVQSQIADCKTQAEKLNLQKETSFVLADYCNTPFEDESFDVVWACESLCHAKEKADFYTEAYRLLKPGGRLIIAEYLRTKRPLEAKDETLLMSWLQPWAIADIDTEQEHLNHAANAGFDAVQIKDVTKNMKVSLSNLHRNSTNWLWFSKILKTIGLRSKVQHGNMCASIRQFEALNKQLWFYSIISAVKP